VRKALEIDVCEERMSFAGETLRFPKKIRAARLFQTREALALNADASSVTLPVAKGRLLVEIPHYFSP
jgi:hypothetical protein